MGKKGKGKQPTGGRAKARAKAQKHSPGSGEYNGGRAQQRHFLDDADDNSDKMFRGFAQSGPRGDFSPRNANVKLRHQAISFVSAGSNTPIELESSKLAEKVAVSLEEEDDEEDGESSEDEVEFEGEFEEDDSTIQTNILQEADGDGELSEGAIGRMNIDDSPPSPSPLEFVIDTAGDPSLAAKASTNSKQANGKARVARSPSPALSDTSDDVVLFHGRASMTVRTVTDNFTQKPAETSKPPPPATSITAPATSITAPAPDRTPHITDDLLAALRASPGPSASPSPAKGWATQPSKHEREAAASSSDAWKPAPAKPYWKSKKVMPRPDLDPQPEELEMLEDTPLRASKVMFQAGAKERGAEATIAELQADWKNTLKEKKRTNAIPQYGEVEELELDLGRKSNRRGKRGRKKSNREMRNAIKSDDEDDSEAAYDDYMQNLAAQLAAEGGGAAAPMPATFMSDAVLGPSIVVNGKEVADDATLKHSNEDEWEDEESTDTDKMIGEDASDLSDDDGLNYSDMESSDLEEELEYTEREQWEDEQDLRQRRQDAMTDEQLARLFAKQEELGINSKDLVIDDGIYEDEDDAMEGIGDLVAARVGLQDISNLSTPTTHTTKRTKRARKAQGDFDFPDASALADTLDQYGAQGFDIMDLERPSLRPTKKGRKSKGQLPPELDALSDDDLRETMLGTWENDREKKRLKKVEREELRQQGLLGSSGRKGKADLGMKYLQGMTMKQVLEELRIFLQDDGQKSRPFPPMDKKDRKTLHEVAGALNLKSKSVGTGTQRFPVLYKTSWTAEYSDFHFEKIMVSAQRGFLKNSLHKGRNKGSGAGRASGGGGGGGSARKPGGGGAGRGGDFDKAAVSLRNGEVVGANAKELGKENFGHKLMEKMGWSAGMALGKEGEGMRVPVAQVMRTGRAGLG
ncbi:squalene synthetase-like protein [Recurvomyces mirabilis]|uniref:Protein SQS1 n=1 Tax=Recurvomyces mirabilis TaxID=574656 RepID=A0AAE0WSS5_9PEZI|nr:squalene synthetase-like protein [Recurvomyces mirabilis]KAK5159591.1 squalene synthetase-like protein [Recurvomyces mirabilis]